MKATKRNFFFEFKLPYFTGGALDTSNRPTSPGGSVVTSVALATTLVETASWPAPISPWQLQEGYPIFPFE